MRPATRAVVEGFTPRTCRGPDHRDCWPATRQVRDGALACGRGVGLMPSGRFLKFFDDGNQRAMDYLRAQPDRGLKGFPYAKSDSARRAATLILAGVGVVGPVGGLLWALAALLVASPFLWRLEHHFFLRCSTSPVDEDPKNADKL